MREECAEKFGNNFYDLSGLKYDRYTMNKYISSIILFLLSLSANAQYNKEKITSILTNDVERSWNVTGLNTDRSEKIFTFNKNGNVITDLKSGVKKTDKWILKSNDNIRWFISIGGNSYELIISYDKAGNQYIKLTHQEVDNKTSGYFEIKLTPVK